MLLFIKVLLETETYIQVEVECVGIVEVWVLRELVSTLATIGIAVIAVLLVSTGNHVGVVEQNRDDSYADGSERTYKFSKNPYLYYANAFNFYLNVGFRF